VALAATAPVAPVRPLALVRLIDDRAHVRRLLDQLQHVQVLRVDAPVRERPRSQPPDQPVPLAVAQQDHGEVADGVGLDQRQALEQLIQRAVAAGADHERAGVADEHDLVREEVAEAQADVHVRVELLLVRQLDVAADRQRADVARAAVGRLHDPGATAGDDRASVRAARAG
jgi:hypothetical protein